MLSLPADGRMFGAGAVVGAAVINVLADATSPQFPADALSGDRLAAVGTLEEAAGQGVFGAPGATVLAIKNVLAGVEGGPINQPLIAALEDLRVAVQFPDIEAV